MEKDLTIIQNITDKITTEIGLPKTDAELIVASFSEVAKSMHELDTELLEFNKHTEITKEVCEQARNIRLRYVKVRTLGDEIHTKIKANVLLRTKAIDGVRNIFKLKATEIETKLKDIELYFEKLEQAKKDKINAERELELSKYVEDVSMYNYKEMTDEVFTSLVSSVKKVWEAEQQAIKQAEEERIEREKAEKEEQERIRVENERLKKEAEARERELEKERAEQNKKFEAEQLKAKKEAEAREKIQIELKKKEEEEKRKKEEEQRKVEQERLAKLEAEKQARLAPDKDKLKLYAKMLSEVEIPELQTEESKQTLLEASKLLNQVLLILRVK